MIFLLQDIIVHPDYSFQEKTNDIALLELVNPVYFSEFLRPACLQTYLSDENPNTNLTTTGWGIISPQCKLIGPEISFISQFDARYLLFQGEILQMLY